jgi:amidophosphoribosyltransferase
MVVAKIVVIILDSIFRGRLVESAVANVRAAGAKAVHLRVAFPPIRAECNYGRGFLRAEELIANYIPGSMLAQSTLAGTTGSSSKLV